MDIRIDTGFLTHHKTVKLQKRLGAEAVLCLIRLWCWCADNRPTGELCGMDAEDIEIVSSWTGDDGVFVDTLRSLGWLDEDGLHGWRERQPWASGAPSRSDKARLSALAMRYPDIYQQYAAQGMTGITKEEYHRVVAEYEASTTAGLSDLANAEPMQSECTASLSDCTAPKPVPIPEPKNTVQKRPIYLSTIEHDLSTELVTSDSDEGDLMFISEYEFGRRYGISDYEMSKLRSRYKDLDLQVELAHMINWVKTHNVHIKNWRAYTKKWLERVINSRQKQ